MHKYQVKSPPIASDEEWEGGAMSPTQWCREMQEYYLDRNDEASAMFYYELAEMWIKRGV